MKWRIYYYSVFNRLVDISFNIFGKKSEAIACAAKRVQTLERDMPLSVPISYKLKREKVKQYENDCSTICR